VDNARHADRHPGQAVVMTFEDLPDNASALPVEDERFAADLVDLFVSHRSRVRGSVLLGIGDEVGRILQPVVIDDVPPDADPAQVVEFVDLMARRLGVTSLLFARGRVGHGAPTDRDRAWHQEIIDACRRHDIRLLGAFVATPDDVVALPPPLERAG
jgi:hypothetical protein